MIIQNGLVSVIEKTSGRIDENGNPIEAVSTLGTPIPCYIRQLKYDYRARTTNGNNYISASYEVLIELQKFEYEHVHLKYRNGKDLGEFSVIHTQDLAAVNATQILV